MFNLILTFGSKAGVKIMFTLQLYKFRDYSLGYSLLNMIQEGPAVFTVITSLPGNIEKYSWIYFKRFRIFTALHNELFSVLVKIFKWLKHKSSWWPAPDTELIFQSFFVFFIRCCCLMTVSPSLHTLTVQLGRISTII